MFFYIFFFLKCLVVSKIVLIFAPEIKPNKTSDMTKEFLHKVAEHRANEIFTPEYFEKATDSWYYDEKDYFESLKCGVKQTKPSEEDTEIYMDKLYELFYKKEDEYFGNDNAKWSYKGCLNATNQLLELIEKDSERYKKFEVDEEIINKLSDVRNFFKEKIETFK